MRSRAFVLSGILSGILSGMLFAVSCAGWAQPLAGSFTNASLAALTRPSGFKALRAHRLASISLGLIDSSDTSPAEKAGTKDSDKAPKTFGETVWAVLNSSFGLWVLSSVVLAWITKAYSARAAHKAETLKRCETAKKLDTEIAYRLAMSLDGTRINEARLQTSPTTPRGIYQVAYNYLENYFIKGPDNRDFSVFPEYRERTFRALILELMTMVNPPEVPDLKKALDAYEELSENGDLGSLDPAPQACLDAYAKVQELLQKRIVRKRWRSMVDFLSVRKPASGIQNLPSRS